MGDPGSPLFQNMILEICPKRYKIFQKGRFPHLQVWRAWSQKLFETTGVLDTPLWDCVEMGRANRTVFMACYNIHVYLNIDNNLNPPCDSLYDNCNYRCKTRFPFTFFNDGFSFLFHKSLPKLKYQKNQRMFHNLSRLRGSCIIHLFSKAKDAWSVHSIGT